MLTNHPNDPSEFINERLNGTNNTKSSADSLKITQFANVFQCEGEYKESNLGRI